MNWFADLDIDDLVVVDVARLDPDDWHRWHATASMKPGAVHTAGRASRWTRSPKTAPGLATGTATTAENDGGQRSRLRLEREPAIDKRPPLRRRLTETTSPAPSNQPLPGVRTERVERALNAMRAHRAKPRGSASSAC